MRLYFDRTSAINDPMMILLQLSLAALMLAFMMEERIRVGKKGFCLLMTLSAIGVLLGSSASVSMIVFRLNGGSLTGGEVMLSVTELILSLYFFARLTEYALSAKAAGEVMTKE